MLLRATAARASSQDTLLNSEFSKRQQFNRDEYIGDVSPQSRQGRGDDASAAPSRNQTRDPNSLSGMKLNLLPEAMRSDGVLDQAVDSLRQHWSAFTDRLRRRLGDDDETIDSDNPAKSKPMDRERPAEPESGDPEFSPIEQVDELLKSNK